MLGSVYVSVWSCVYILEKESFNHTPGARYEKCITGGVQVSLQDTQIPLS